MYIHMYLSHWIRKRARTIIENVWIFQMNFCIHGKGSVANGMLTNTFTSYTRTDTQLLDGRLFFFCFICLSLSLPHLSYGCCSWFNVRSHFFTNTNSRSDSTSRCIATEHTHTHILSFTYDMNLKQKNTAKSIFKLHTKNSQHCEAICKRLLLLSFDSKSKLSQ